MEDSEFSFFLKYLPMEITLISQEKASLPTFLGSTLRGVIGQALYQDRDAYQYLYHNQALSGNMRDILNPYVILPPQNGKGVYQKGEALIFQILFLGEAVRYTQRFVQAIQRIDKFGLGVARYPFKLEKIMHLFDQRIIWKNSTYHETAVRSIVLPYRFLPAVQQLQVTILTPLRIRRDWEILDKLDFSTLIRNIARRLEMLTDRYGGWIDREEVKRIQALSSGITTTKEDLEFVDLQRYSNRLGKKMELDGLMGEIWFEGELTPFVPWLYAAQTLHLGRNTTFGMGRVQIEFV